MRPGIEIETLPEFDARLTTGVRDISGWRLQSVDLRQRTTQLLRLEPDGAVFLGCLLEPEADRYVRAHGALVFPPVPDAPVDPYRSALYTPGELYAGLSDETPGGRGGSEGSGSSTKGYEQTPDALAYAWYGATAHDRDVFHSMLRSVHDDSVSDACDEFLAGRRVVGVMGGHAVGRGTPRYADAARMARGLTRAGLTVATGGGPGAMEAANLGAFLAPYPDQLLDEALPVLAAAPSFTPSITDWAKAAFAVRDLARRTHPDVAGGRSLGVPTWFYGHEPPNAFASDIAKYFANATREDGLLARSDTAVVYLPGAAGTVQEIFQQATPQYYATATPPVPMVLVGEAHWTKELPVWPLLTALAGERPMASAVHLVDSVEEALELITAR
jgi:predicted Rossmann-fold nucleotide-binding protein